MEHHPSDTSFKRANEASFEYILHDLEQFVFAQLVPFDFIMFNDEVDQSWLERWYF